MKSEVIHDGVCRWIMMGRDADKPGEIIDTNQYLLISGGEALLLDPGGIEIFAPMLSEVTKHIRLSNLRHLFASHQDPDIISSLGLWDQVLDNGRLHASWIWKGFITHFGMERIQYCGIPDEGGQLELGDVRLEFIPAHYLHSSANFSLYDPTSKILFSGDIGAALEPPESPLYVDDFDAHVQKMRFFHQRWMANNQAKQEWVDRVRMLDVELMVPQHGRLFRRDDVRRFLDWFEGLEVGLGSRAKTQEPA